MIENLVNKPFQKSSQKIQLFVHNYPVSIQKDTITLAEFVSQIMSAKSLSAREVERRSGKLITHSYVNKIKNGDALNPSPHTLQGLAKGLGVTEEQIFALVRGKVPSRDEITNEKLAMISFGFEEMPKKKREKLEPLIDLLEREYQRIKNEPE